MTITALTRTCFAVTADSMADVVGIIRDTGFVEVPCDPKYVSKRWKNGTTHITLHHTMEVRVSGNGGIIYHHIINRFHTAIRSYRG